MQSHRALTARERAGRSCLTETGCVRNENPDTEGRKKTNTGRKAFTQAGTFPQTINNGRVIGLLNKSRVDREIGELRIEKAVTGWDPFSWRLIRSILAVSSPRTTTTTRYLPAIFYKWASRASGVASVSCERA